MRKVLLLSKFTVALHISFYLSIYFNWKKCYNSIMLPSSNKKILWRKYYMSTTNKKEIQLLTNDKFRPLEERYLDHDFVMVQIPIKYDFFDDTFRRRMNDAWNREQVLPRIPAFANANAFIESVKEICPVLSMMRGKSKADGTYVVVNIARREANKGSRLEQLEDLIVAYNN